MLVSRGRVVRVFSHKDVDCAPRDIGIHNLKNVEGRLFLDFLTLITYSHISKVAREEKIVKDYTVQEIMYELKKIKLIHLGEKKDNHYRSIKETERII